MHRVRSVFFTLCALFSIACTDKHSVAEDPQTDAVTASHPPYFMDDSEAIDFDAVEVRNIRETFGQIPGSEKSTSSSHEDDRICAQYLHIADMGIALGKSDFLWQQAGISKEKGLQIYADSAALLTKKMEEFIVLSDDELILRIATWRHGCNGMFNPVERDRFIDDFTRLHIDAGIPRPFQISPELKSSLLRHYRKQIRNIEEKGLLAEDYSRDTHSPPSLHAFYWFTLKELVDTANVR